MKKLMLLCMSIVAVSANATVCTDFDKNNNIIEYECEKQPVKTVKNNIDVVDKNGNTALCNAILNDDVEAYNTLKLQGANTEHKCVNNIPKEQYDSFIKKVVNPNKSVLSFSVGNISMGNMGWGLLGLGAAGLAAGTIFSGGGSGGGSDAGTNSTPQNHISQCHDLGYTYKYSDECPNGWLKNNNDYCNDEDGITVWFKCNIAQTCSEPYRINCQNGYEEVIGDICLSGTTVYKRCVAATCEGFTYSQSQNCPEGWVKGSSCLSGTTMKYKCDTASPCYGYTASCNTGYIPITGDTCKSGNNTLVKCKFDTVNFIIQNGQIYPRLNCVHGNQNGAVCSCNEGWTGTLCDTAVDCGSDYQASCGLGYIETNTCKSGNDTLIKCELDNEHYIEQNGQVYNKLNCEHGEQIENTCFCANGWGGSLCDTVNTCSANFQMECTGGYIETNNTCQSGNIIYKECVQIQCGANAVWSELGCGCNSGYENWTDGIGCSLIPLECGANAHQNGTQCQCDSGYTNWTDGVGCSLIPLECGANAHQNGTQCQCDSGYTNWTDGVGCSLIYLDCGVFATQQGTQCQCYSGYTQWTSGYGCYYQRDCGVNATQQGFQCVCDLGYAGWTEGYGCYEDIDCGANAYQNGTQCQCDIGYTQWTPGYGCYPYKNCGKNAHQNGTQCICENGYENWTDGVGCMLPSLNCGSHAYQNGSICSCDSGYENWTDGVGCSLIYLDCGAHASQQGIQCQCDTGYTNWSAGVGCFAILDCGSHAYQNGANCTCEPGYENWTDGVGCSVFGINDTTNPYNNYIDSLTDTTTYGKYNEIVEKGGGWGFEAYANDNTYITKESNGDVYGIFIDDNFVPAYTYSGYAACVCLADVSSGAASTILINKNGTGNVYGIYADNYSVLNAGNYGGGGPYYGPNGLDDSYLDEHMIGGNIIINNSGTGVVYGLYSQFGSVFNARNQDVALIPYVIGNINIYNTNNNNDVYGIASPNRYTYNADRGVGNIFIHNIGNGDIYGVYNGSNNGSNVDNGGTGIIDIYNIGDGDIYGVYNGSNVVSGSVGETIGIIDIYNIGNGDVYGLYSKNVAYNSSGGNGLITIKNYGIGTAYGIYAHVSHNVTLYGLGKIDVINYLSGNVFGMYGENASNENATTDIGQGTSTINIQNLSTGNATGIYTTGNATIYTINSATNSGTITINNTGTGTAIGIFGDTNSTINNSGLINITRNSYIDENNVLYEPTGTAGDVFGIYAKAGSTVNNSGNINITTNGNAYGIYVESGSTVTNTGTISINGVGCGSSTCSGSSDYGNHIVLNGSTLYNSGVVQANTLNLNSMGGKVVAGLGSQFVVDNELSGDLNISSDIVMDGNQTTYVANNMIDAGDISKLNVRSASAMFDASLADNKHDIVMQMKDFNELTDNASLAQFLADNYAKGNGDDLFTALKSLENMSAFNGALAGLTGLDTFTQFAHEDLSAMREISFSMNNKLFENSNRDSFDISDSMGYFSFSDSHNGGNGRYGISNDKITDKLKLGYGMAMANINTNDGHGMNRQNKMWLFYMPLTYTDEGYELVIAPKAGFANSEYNRRGYNNMNYEGYIEKRIFGLMNDLRYPLIFGNWTFAPDLAFNAIVYDQSGHEQEQEFSLIIPDDRTVSVETGLGLYTKYEKTLKDGSRFKLNSGLMVYREFGDTYDIKLGMRGMDGTFSLYNNDYEYRGAASIGFDYMAGSLRLYGNAQYFMDNDNYMNFKGGISYRF